MRNPLFMKLMDKPRHWSWKCLYPCWLFLQQLKNKKKQKHFAAFWGFFCFGLFFVVGGGFLFVFLSLQSYEQQDGNSSCREGCTALISYCVIGFIGKKLKKWEGEGWFILGLPVAGTGMKCGCCGQRSFCCRVWFYFLSCLEVGAVRVDEQMQCFIWKKIFGPYNFANQKKLFSNGNGEVSSSQIPVHTKNHHFFTGRILKQVGRDKPKTSF